MNFGRNETNVKHHRFHIHYTYCRFNAEANILSLRRISVVILPMWKQLKTSDRSRIKISVVEFLLWHNRNENNTLSCLIAPVDSALKSRRFSICCISYPHYPLDPQPSTHSPTSTHNPLNPQLRPPPPDPKGLLCIVKCSNASSE